CRKSRERGVATGTPLRYEDTVPRCRRVSEELYCFPVRHALEEPGGETFAAPGVPLNYVEILMRCDVGYPVRAARDDRIHVNCAAAGREVDTVGSEELPIVFRRVRRMAPKLLQSLHEGGIASDDVYAELILFC